jgi:hypothetical protein
MLAVILRTDGELRHLSSAEDKEQAGRLARYAVQLLTRSAEDALAAAGRESDEELVHGISEFEYKRAGAGA